MRDTMRAETNPPTPMWPLCTLTPILSNSPHPLELGIRSPQLLMISSKVSLTYDCRFLSSSPSFSPDIYWPMRWFSFLRLEIREQTLATHQQNMAGLEKVLVPF